MRSKPVSGAVLLGLTALSVVMLSRSGFASPAWDLVDANAREWKTIELEVDAFAPWLRIRRLLVEQRCGEGNRGSTADFSDATLSAGDSLTLRFDGDYDDDGSTTAAEADSTCSYRLGVAVWNGSDGLTDYAVCDEEFSEWFHYAEAADIEYVEVTGQRGRCNSVKLRTRTRMPSEGAD